MLKCNKLKEERRSIWCSLVSGVGVQQLYFLIGSLDGRLIFVLVV